MMVKLVNRANMTTATTGTGTITLGTARAGFQSFGDAGVLDGDTVRYVIEDGDDWEIGTGVYTSSVTTLTRVVEESSAGGAALNLSGAAVVFVTAVAGDFLGYRLRGAPILITTSGTYTPDPEVKAVLIRAQGAGGPGGRVGATGASQCAYSGGGESGAYAEKLIINPAPATIIIGAAGIASATPTDGGMTSYDDGTSLIECMGGAAAPARASVSVDGGSGQNGGYGPALATGGDLNINGQPGWPGAETSSGRGFAGAGGSSRFGNGGRSTLTTGASSFPAGEDGDGFGSGGSGAGNSVSQSARNGGDGRQGCIEIVEFI